MRVCVCVPLRELGGSAFRGCVRMRVCACVPLRELGGTAFRGCVALRMRVCVALRMRVWRPGATRAKKVSIL